ncbi:hypothetical protein INS49_015140 [Diaporthe citri]|uniref:uncharacterized protein n=1 Tax=Diaporthe citri TaxID=83186 RepID=UPI001C806A08|nr:uncharacterized protein INS49_015140 [Diaporthe citri]KAG6357262.1 hypothetical protein INS49_015140 [Diaporthe citri]
MIDESWRYFAYGGAITAGGPSRWDILDWDQRRTISVNLPTEEYDSDVAINLLRKHVDKLDPDVFAISISEQDEIAVSKDPEDDETQCPHYPAFDDVECAEWTQAVSRGQLREVERLGPNVDLTSYASPNLGEAKQAVFKYYFLDRFLFRRWDELNIWMRLPSHPFIVPFDRLVVDQLEGRDVVVGFTSVYIPGGTVEENTSRTFKLKWLKQLLCAVDDLNLKYGIQHQDIAPRNLLVDEEADKLLLFDFNFAARIGYPRREEDHEQHSIHRDDIKGFLFTIYEIITRDMHFREIPHHEQDSKKIFSLEQWQQHPQVRLDHPVAEFRSVLDSWYNSRRQAQNVSHYTEASEYIDWPGLKPPPQDDLDDFVPDSDVDDDEAAFGLEWSKSRRDQREQGLEFLDWQRPPQDRIPQGCYLLASGAVISEDH